MALWSRCSRNAACAALLAALTYAGVAQAVPLRDEALGFTLDIPDGFQPYDALKPHSDARTRRFVQENTLYAYHLGGDPERGDYSGIFLQIERSDSVGVTGPGDGSLPADTQRLEERWQGMAVNLYRIERTYTTRGDRMVVLTAVIPLAAQPIQIKLTGDLRDEPRMRADLRGMLDSLEGDAALSARAGWMKYPLAAAALLGIGFMVRRGLA